MMHLNTLVRRAVSVLLCLLPALTPAAAHQGHQLAESKTAAGARESPELSELLERWHVAATPGEPHRFLDDLVGHWRTTTRIWVRGPDASPHQSTGTSTIEWILGGRFLREEARGTLLGRAVAGLGILGYDTTRERFESFWVDTMSTGVYASTGKLEDDGRSVSLEGTVDDPATGALARPVRYLLTKDGKDRFRFAIYDTSTGHPIKVMETAYERTM
jgi:hypothetical protein